MVGGANLFRHDPGMIPVLGRLVKRFGDPPARHIIPAFTFTSLK